MKGMKRKGKSEERRGEKEEMGWLAVALGRGRRELFSSPLPFLPLSPFGLLGVRQMGSIHYPSPSFHQAKEKGWGARLGAARAEQWDGLCWIASVDQSAIRIWGVPQSPVGCKPFGPVSRLTTKTPHEPCMTVCLTEGMGDTR